ncbi:fungal-specific transcription factor domain-containing protein [Xylaria venustula]|nr:fungal-specific transcription factor domain-containing protein [Xylaria venustula]
MNLNGKDKKIRGRRSQTGCWTCKLRRKKCDENQPVCRTCECLRIPCEGYGPKPIWMDRGPLEKETAERVKIAVAQNGQKGARSRYKAASISSLSRDRTQDETVRDNEPQKDISIHTTPLPQGSDQSLTPIENLFTADNVDWQGISLQGVGDMTGSNISSLPLFSPTGYELDCFPLPAVNSVGSEETGCVASTPVPRPDDNISPRAVAPNETNLEQPEFSEGSSEYHNRGFSISRENQISSIFSTSTGSQSAEDRESHEENAILLSYYMSKVMPKQFFFTWVSRPEDMQWLQYLLLSSKQVLNVSMILSKAHHIDAIGSVEAETELSGVYNHDMSEIARILKTLPSPSATVSLFDDERRISQTVWACTSLIQGIQLEIFYGGSSCWADYLQEAGSYTQSLIDLTVSGEKQHLATSGSISNGASQLHLMAAKVLLGKLMWFDILATVSTGKGPFLGIKHEVLLESDKVDMTKTSGCHNAIVVALGKITRLKTWKLWAESQRTLSMIELVTRGSTIVDSLNSLISSLTDCPQETSEGAAEKEVRIPHRLANICPEELVTDITVVYARAAIVYVHFILSGFNLHVQEIRVGAADLMESLQKLSESGMMGYALWPLCVAACAVRDEEEERSLFQFMTLGNQDQSRHQVHWQTYCTIVTLEWIRERDNVVPYAPL